MKNEEMRQDLIMKRAAVLCTIFTVLVMIFLVVYMKNRTIIYTSGGTLQENAAESVDKIEQAAETNTYTLELNESEQSGVVSVPITEQITEDKLTVVNDYFTQTITIYINGLAEDYYRDQNILADLQCVGVCDYTYEDGITRLQLELDSVYEYELTKERTNLRLTLKKPSEIYDYIILIDAGHGGSDDGIMENAAREDSIVLAIAEQMQGLMDPEKYGYYFTRLSDSSLTDEDRVQFVDQIGADLFVSIHLASDESEEMYGINVYYNNEYYTNSFDTAQFSASLATKIAQNTCNRANGVFAASKEHQPLLLELSIPAVEIEAGYVSNAREAALLQTEEYQKMIAAGMIDTIEETLQMQNGA